MSNPNPVTLTPSTPSTISDPTGPGTPAWNIFDIALDRVQDMVQALHDANTPESAITQWLSALCTRIEDRDWVNDTETPPGSERPHRDLTPIRQFLLEYAPPSIISDLISTTPSTPNTPIHTMLTEVLTALTGAPILDKPLTAGELKARLSNVPDDSLIYIEDHGELTNAQLSDYSAEMEGAPSFILLSPTTPTTPTPTTT